MLVIIMMSLYMQPAYRHAVIRKVDVSIESGGYENYNYDVCVDETEHLCMLFSCNLGTTFVLNWAVSRG